MELRLANKKDLPYLKIMFKKIINNMAENNIKIWNKYYPFEEFKDEIEQERLYLLVQEGDIVSAFVLFENIEGQENFNWKEAKPAVYNVKCVDEVLLKIHKKFVVCADGKIADC